MRECMRSFFSILIVFLMMSSARADVIERVSVSSSGIQGNDLSKDSSLSADGRFVAFESLATNLVAGDTNGEADIFVHDTDAGVTERISVSSNRLQANGWSANPSLSADGRFVVFRSVASNLVIGDTNIKQDIFVHDRNTKITERVSISSTGVQAKDHSGSPSISADGRFVAFVSQARKLVPGDTNNRADIFVHDRDTGMTKRVSVSSTGAQANGFSGSPWISADGRVITFESYASNLVIDDTNNWQDIFLHDRQTGISERVSVSSSAQQANANSFYPSISADNRFVAFYSRARNLVPGDTNGSFDIFVHDREVGLTERISVSSTGEQANSDSFVQALSADGRFVAFRSVAGNLVSGDTDTEGDIFLHDRNTRITQRVSVSLNGVQANDRPDLPSISADGRFVAFNADTTNLVADDTNEVEDVFVTENFMINSNNDLTVALRRTSGATPVGDYIRFRVRFENNGNTALTNCKAVLVNPLVNFQREFSYYSWPLSAANPVLNGAIDIAAGESGQFNLAILPRVAMRREVNFVYDCDGVKALTVPFINSLHLTAKTEPLIAEDFVHLANSNSKNALVVDLSKPNYWTPHSITVSNTGSEATSVTVTTTSDFADAVLRQSRLCEPLDPANNEWSCITPGDVQIDVELAAGEVKKLLVFVHARVPIAQRKVQNRINIEARGATGEIVAKTSLGISTLD